MRKLFYGNTAMQKAGEPVAIGDKVLTFRGEPVEVTGIFAPTHAGSTGRVEISEDGHSRLVYPSVIDAEWRNQ